MAPIDNRLPTTDFTTSPLNAVVAVDISYDPRTNRQGTRDDYSGSGITIAPNHVLTAGHNAYDRELGRKPDRLRTTASGNLSGLMSRVIGNFLDSGPNVVEPYFFPKGYDVSELQADDLALLKTDDQQVPTTDTIGLLAFVKPETAQNLSIVTAGYPSEEGTGAIRQRPRYCWQLGAPTA
jgi:V8-like Glu-specific endopeptidase